MSKSLIEEYLKLREFYSFEGERGVDRLEEVVRDVGGYGCLREFLADNPGAIDAVVEFVAEWVPRIPEWRESLEGLLDE